MNTWPLDPAAPEVGPSKEDVRVALTATVDALEEANRRMHELAIPLIARSSVIESRWTPEIYEAPLPEWPATQLDLGDVVRLKVGSRKDLVVTAMEMSVTGVRYEARYQHAGPMSTERLHFTFSDIDPMSLVRLAGKRPIYRTELFTGTEQAILKDYEYLRTLSSGDVRSLLADAIDAGAHFTDSLRKARGNQIFNTEESDAPTA